MKENIKNIILGIVSTIAVSLGYLYVNANGEKCLVTEKAEISEQQAEKDAIKEIEKELADEIPAEEITK